MLFIHQAPRNWQENGGRAGAVTPSRQSPSGDPRLRSGRRTPTSHAPANQRRPSSAVGSGPNAGSNTTGGGSGGGASNTGESPARRSATAERQRANTPSRPGSASSGLGRFAVRPNSPPTSARAGAYSGGSSGGDGERHQQAQPSMPRPVTPTGGRSSSAGRAQNGPVRVPSMGPAPSLPIHVTTVGRPRTPTAQRRAPSNGGSTAALPGDRRGSSEKPWASGSDGGSLATTATGGTMKESSSGHQSSGRSDGSVAGGSNNLTTVISSALDYKRFLDRRKQMIQQQVESAQQASASTRQDQSAADRQSSSAGHSHGSVAAADAETGGQEAVGATSGAAASSSGCPPGGWNPGSAGPVKANHMVQAASNAKVDTVAGLEWLAEDDAGAGRSQRVKGGSKEPGVTKGSISGNPAGEDASREDVGAATPTSARSCGSSTATQHLLRRVCVAPDQSRAETPTRYVQSCAAAPTATSSSGAAERDSSTGRSSSRCITPMPVGGARQACRSLGQQEGRERCYAGIQAETELNDDRSGAGDGAAVGSGARGQSTPAGRHRENSLDGGLLRDAGDNRAVGSSLSGNAIEDYIVGKQIGQGAYATVYFGLHKETSRKVAIKIYEKYKLLDPQRRKSVRCEIRLMERMRHPNIVVFHDALDTAKQIYIIMEFVGGGSMHHYLKKRPGRRLEDHVAKRLFYQVCQGLRYLHDRHIVHRDIKLENLLLDENGTVKIIDFGFSTIVPPGKKLKVFCGTPSYMAPEIVARKEYSGFCADIWAAGVLLYALLCGSFPFRGQNDRDLYRKIVRGVFHVPDLVGDGARNLLGRILTPDMVRRPVIDDVFSDPWLQGHRDELYEGRSKSSCSGYQPNSSTSSTATTAAPSSSAGQSAREISAVPSDPPPLAASRAPSASSSSGRAIQDRPGSSHPNSRAASHQTPTPPPGAANSGPQGTAPARTSASSAAQGASSAAADSGASAAANASATNIGAGVTPASSSRAGSNQASGAIGGAEKIASSSSGSTVAKGAGLNSVGVAAAALAPSNGSDSAEQHSGTQGTSVGRSISNGAAASAAAGAVASSSSANNRRIEEEAINKLERLGYPYEEIVRQLKDESSHLCKLYHRFLKALTAWDNKR